MPSNLVPTMRSDVTAWRCIATMMRVRVKVMAEQATDHRSADTLDSSWGSASPAFAFTCLCLLLMFMFVFVFGWSVYDMNSV